MSFKALALLLPTSCLTLVASPSAKGSEDPPNATSLAVYLLEQLNEREQLAYQRYESAVSAEDVDQVRRDLQSVIDGYESLIAQSPDFAPAFVSYGLMLNRTGNRDEANAAFLKADLLDPMLPVVKNQIGNYLAEEGEYLQAYGFYLLARDLDPKQSLYAYQIGNLLVAYRKFFLDDGLMSPFEIDQQILENFEQAVRHSPRGDKVSYRLRHAQAYFDVDNPDWQEALELWQQLLTNAGSDYEKQVVRIYLARVRLELGHHQAARKLLKQVEEPSLEESRQSILDLVDAEYPQ